MLKAAPLPPDASIASTGLGIRYIGSHCYAMGGLTAAVGYTDVIQKYAFASDANATDVGNLSTGFAKGGGTQV